MLLPQGENPYIMLSSELIHERQYLRFFKDKVRIGQVEKDYSYMVVDNSAGIVALNQKGEIALVGQWRYPVKGYRWEIPAGMCELNEQPEETAARELYEEAGVKAKQWASLGSYQMEASKMDQRSFVFLAQDLELGDNAPMEDEKLERQWVPLEDAVRMIERGELDEALTVIAILRAQAYLHASER